MKKRKNFYGTDYVDKDFGGTFNDEEEELLQLEEEDAIKRQKKLDILNAAVDFSIFDSNNPTDSEEDKKALKTFNEKISVKKVEFVDVDSGKNNKTEKEVPLNDDKRYITYEMQANKGIILKKRRKDSRHARIKKRKQYDKALIRRRSQIPDIRHEINRYDGEKRGIRASTVRSIKLK